MGAPITIIPKNTEIVKRRAGQRRRSATHTPSTFGDLALGTSGCGVLTDVANDPVQCRCADSMIDPCPYPGRAKHTLVWF